MKAVEPVPVVVAKAKVKGVAQIELQPLGEFVAKSRQPIQVKYLYRLEEQSKDKENWRFRLASKIGAQAPAPAQANWADRWGRNDSLWGVLQQEYVFDKPGTYEGSFTVDVQHTESDWGSDAVKKQAERKAEGKFRIRVL